MSKVPFYLSGYDASDHLWGIHPIYLWRAVDQKGEILESFVTKKRDKDAALSSMKRTLTQVDRTICRRAAA